MIKFMQFFHLKTLEEKSSTLHIQSLDRWIVAFMLLIHMLID